MRWKISEIYSLLSLLSSLPSPLSHWKMTFVPLSEYHHLTRKSVVRFDISFYFILFRQNFFFHPSQTVLCVKFMKISLTLWLLSTIIFFSIRCANSCIMLIVWKTIRKNWNENENEMNKRRGGNVLFVKDFEQKADDDKRVRKQICLIRISKNEFEIADNCMKMTYRLVPQYWLCFDEPFRFLNDDSTFDHFSYSSSTSFQFVFIHNSFWFIIQLILFYG